MKDVFVERLADNQYIVYTESVERFQSYNTIIAKKYFNNGTIKTVLDRSKWDYSVTTGKYRNRFLGETKKETEAKIKSGEYTLEDLN